MHVILPGMTEINPPTMSDPIHHRKRTSLFYRFCLILLALAALWLVQSSYRDGTLKTAATALLSRLVVSSADQPGDLLGVFRDARTEKVRHDVIIFRGAADHLTGVWSMAYDGMGPEKIGSWHKVQPIDKIQLRPDGSLTFDVLWDMGFNEGRRSMRHYFRGRLSGNHLIGDFTSDWSSLRPYPIDASKQTDQTLGQPVTAYATELKKRADAYLADISLIMACQSKRAQLPSKPIEVLGVWEEYQSIGEHAHSTELALFRVAEQVYGWMMDYGGLAEFRGARVPIQNAKFDSSTRKFEFSLPGGPMTRGQWDGETLLLSGNSRVAQRLQKKRHPTAEAMWSEYRALTVPCVSGISSK
jgi:hypothetical protein